MKQIKGSSGTQSIGPEWSWSPANSIEILTCEGVLPLGQWFFFSLWFDGLGIFWLLFWEPLRAKVHKMDSCISNKQKNENRVSFSTFEICVVCFHFYLHSLLCSFTWCQWENHTSFARFLHQTLEEITPKAPDSLGIQIIFCQDELVYLYSPVILFHHEVGQLLLVGVLTTCTSTMVQVFLDLHQLLSNH